MRTIIPIHLIELEPDNFHVTISSFFPDGQTRNWVIDTGASKTVFDKRLEEYFSVLEGESDEIHTAGNNEQPQEISMALLAQLQIGKLKIENFKVALLDLSHINELYSKSTNLKICGLIGGDFLMKYKAVIDYKKKRLVLSN
ncbi:retroviral-like aspartic protease family protein [Draconibacterium sp.]|nr:retroviral-like aspartic protease family protein [Draconibacterium sp.]